MTVGRRLLALFLLGGVLAACSIGQRAAGPQSASCGDIPSGACDEQLEKVGLRHPGAMQIDIELRQARPRSMPGFEEVLELPYVPPFRAVAEALQPQSS